MGKAKKIIGKIIGGGFEAVKESAKQIADTVSPGALLEQALGKQKQSENTMGDYLKNLGDPSLTGDKLKEKEGEFKTEDEKKIEEARKLLQAAGGLPAHMRLPPKEKELRPYELTVQEEEKKKAAQVEAQKKQRSSMPAPSGKQPRGMLFGKRKSGGKGFEGLSKDTKVG
ncbi:hypothetical protein M1271_00760 [Patescibacteria group bacterium]|nr:hypothetical protein [Patescibacteria group bacterium]MCL5797549.1 hypothetical protein [Patescibacteria group bacterium]